MNILETIDLDKLITKVVAEKCEITINLDPEHAEIKIEPWKPFTYTCPYTPTYTNPCTPTYTSPDCSSISCDATDSCVTTRG